MFFRQRPERRQGGSFKLVVDRLYYAEGNDVSTGFTFDTKAIAEALKKIYEKNFNPMTDIESRLFFEFWDKLNIATNTGITQSGVDIDADFRDALRQNNGVFAAFKTHRLQNDMAALLLDSNGVRRSFKEWVKDARPIADHQVYSWFKTEYSTAINRANHAANWKQYEKEAHILPNLEWRPSTSANPRELHCSFYGLILPIKHPFWNKHRPGDLWNCQCHLSATNAKRTPEDKIPIKLSQSVTGLDNNPAVDGKIFSDSHPYITKAYKGADEAVKDVMESDLIKRYLLYRKLREDDNYINVEFDYTTGALMATHKEHNFDPRKGYYEKNTQKAGFNAGDCVVLEKEDHTVKHKKNVEGKWNGRTFEIAGKENLNPNNIRDGLKHAAKKGADVAVLYFSDIFDVESFGKGLEKYNGLSNDINQYKLFELIICIEKDRIVYKKSHQ